MPRKALGLLAVTGVAIVVAGAGVVLRWFPGSTQEAASRQLPYVYITARHLVLMQDTKVLARVSRIFDESDSDENDVVWSHSGNYVAFFSDAKQRLDDEGRTELIILDARTGRQARVPCPECEEIVAVGKDGILAMVSRTDEEGGTSYWQFDLSAPRGGVEVEDYSAISGFFLSSTSDYILTHQGSYPRGPSELFQKLVFFKVADWTEGFYGFGRSNDYMPVAPITSDRGRSQRVAVALRMNPGECAADFPVVILDPSRRTHTSTDMSAARPPGYVQGENGGVEVNDLWWGPDGRLRATIASWTCDATKDAEDEKQVPVSPSTLWRLDGTRWAKEGAGPATMVRLLDTETRITLVVPDCRAVSNIPDPVAYCNTGALYQDQTGKRTPIASDVISISTSSPNDSPPRNTVISTPTPTPTGSSPTYHVGE